jgi:hypothetical protein
VCLRRREPFGIAPSKTAGSSIQLLRIDFHLAAAKPRYATLTMKGLRKAATAGLMHV